MKLLEIVGSTLCLYGIVEGVWKMARAKHETVDEKQEKYINDAAILIVASFIGMLLLVFLTLLI